MADLDDFDYASILNMGDDEALELLREIRLRRNTPNKTRRVTTKKAPSKVSVDAATAAKLLAILGGDK